MAGVSYTKTITFDAKQTQHILCLISFSPFFLHLVPETEIDNFGTIVILCKTLLLTFAESTEAIKADFNVSFRCSWTDFSFLCFPVYRLGSSLSGGGRVCSPSVLQPCCGR